MLLGIVIHGAMAYLTTPVPFWPAHDEKTSTLCDLYVFTVHSFRMQLFFLLSGYFASQTVVRRGLAEMLRLRVVRVGVVLLFGSLVLQPLLQLLWMYGDPSALKYVTEQQGRAFDDSVPRDQMIAEHFGTGKFVGFILPFHLWFLYYLLVFFLGAALVRAACRRLSSDEFRARCWGWADRQWAAGRVSWIMFALMLPPLFGMRTSLVDTPSDWSLPPTIVCYYAVFFAAGWSLGLHRDRLDALVRPWRRYLIFGCLLWPVALMASGMLARHHRGDLFFNDSAYWGIRAVAHVAGAGFTLCAVWGLIGVTRRYLSAGRPWVRWLADASYWCYVMSLFPLVALQIWFMGVDVPLLVKLVVVHGASMAVLLAAYQVFVRYSLIGRVMNGRRLPATSPPNPPLRFGEGGSGQGRVSSLESRL